MLNLRLITVTFSLLISCAIYTQTYAQCVWVNRSCENFSGFDETVSYDADHSGVSGQTSDNTYSQCREKREIGPCGPQTRYYCITLTKDCPGDVWRDPRRFVGPEKQDEEGNSYQCYDDTTFRGDDWYNGATVIDGPEHTPPGDDSDNSGGGSTGGSSTSGSTDGGTTDGGGGTDGGSGTDGGGGTDGGSGTDDGGGTDGGSGTDGGDDSSSNDPTSEVEQEGECADGSECNKEKACGSPILLNTKEFFLREVDFKFRSTGIPFFVERVFASRRFHDRGFGKGWSLNHDIYLIQTSNGAYGGDISVFFPNHKIFFRYHQVEGQIQLSNTYSGNYTITDLGSSWKIKEGSQRVYVFEKSTGLLSYQEQAGNRLSYGYDAQGRLQTINELRFNYNLQFSYNAANKISQIEDNFGRTWKYRYDHNDRLEEVENPLGDIRTYFHSDVYDDSNITALSNYNGEIEYEATYSSDDFVSSFKEFGQHVDLTYASDKIVRTYETGRQNVLKYTRSRLIESEEINGDKLFNKAYNDRKQLISFTDEHDQSWHYRYDDYGNLTHKILVNVDRIGAQASYPTTSLLENPYQTIPFQDSFTYLACSSGGSGGGNGDGGGCIEVTEYFENTRIEWEIGSNSTDTTNCSTKGGFDYLTEKELKPLLYNGASLRSSPLPYYRLSSDPDNCVYTDLSPLSDLVWTMNYQSVADAWVVTKTTDPEGNETLNEYYSNGLVKKRTTPSGRVMNFEYDLDSQLTKIIDGRGNSILENIYDPVTKRLIQTNNAEGHSRYYTYDIRGNQETFTDFDGNVITMQYDILDRVVHSIYPPDNFGQIRQSSKTYDAEGNLKTATDGRGYTIEHFYDSYNQLIKTLYPDSSEIEYKYDGFGNQIEIITKNDGIYKTKYDHRDRVIETENPLGHKNLYEYDSGNNLVKSVSPRGFETTREYDYLYRLSKYTTPLGDSYISAYDVNGNKILSIDPDQITVQRTYLDGELLSNSTLYSQSISLTTSYVYERSTSLKLATVNPKQFVTQYEYDKNYQLVKRINPDLSDVEYVYNPNGSVVSVTNELNHTWNRSYDDLEQLISHTNTLGDSVTYQYDNNGNLSRQSWPEGNFKTHSYDEMDRVTHVAFYDSNSQLEDEFLLQYDVMGNLISASSQDVTVIRSYDLINRLKQVDIPELSRQLIFEYDDDSNRTAFMVVNTDDQSFSLIQYQYDGDNQLTRIDENGRYTYFTYTDAGRPQFTTYPNGVVREHQYDSIGRLKRIEYTLNSQIIQFFDYQYDLNSNVTHVTNNDGTIVYQYDNRDRVTRADYPDGQFEEFGYDVAGNRSYWNKNGDYTSYTYNSDNQLVYDSKYTYTYDLNGSLTSRQHTVTQTTVNYGFSARNRLSSVSFDDGLSTTFKYYPGSTLRYSATGKSGVTTRFLYENVNEKEFISDDGSSITTIVNHPYGYDSRMYLATETSVNLLITDHLNSVRGFKSSTANVTLDKEFTYYAFGGIKTTPLENLQFSFGGRIYDKETDLYYYRGRYYNACVGGFLRVDPTQDGTNWFIFAAQNPLIFGDPTGFETWDQLLLNGGRKLYDRYEDRTADAYNNFSQWANCKRQKSFGEIISDATDAAIETFNDGLEKRRENPFYDIENYINDTNSAVGDFASALGEVAGEGRSSDDVADLLDATLDLALQVAGRGRVLKKKGGKDHSPGSSDSTSSKKKGKNNDPKSSLPRDEPGNYLKDDDAVGPHTVLGKRKGRKGEYTQGATFDKDGNFLGRTDVTDHGRPSQHPDNPHFHPATGPNSVGPGGPIKSPEELGLQ